MFLKGLVIMPNPTINSYSVTPLTNGNYAISVKNSNMGAIQVTPEQLKVFKKNQLASDNFTKNDSAKNGVTFEGKEDEAPQKKSHKGLIIGGLIVAAVTGFIFRKNIKNLWEKIASSGKNLAKDGENVAKEIETNSDNVAKNKEKYMNAEKSILDNQIEREVIKEQKLLEQDTKNIKNTISNIETNIKNKYNKKSMFERNKAEENGTITEEIVDKVITSFNLQKPLTNLHNAQKRRLAVEELLTNETYLKTLQKSYFKENKYLIKTEVEAVIDHYKSIGDIEKAEKFQKLIKQ